MCPFCYRCSSSPVKRWDHPSQLLKKRLQQILILPMQEFANSTLSCNLRGWNLKKKEKCTVVSCRILQITNPNLKQRQMSKSTASSKKLMTEKLFYRYRGIFYRQRILRNKQKTHRMVSLLRCEQLPRIAYNAAHNS